MRDGHPRVYAKSSDTGAQYRTVAVRETTIDKSLQVPPKALNSISRLACIVAVVLLADCSSRSAIPLDGGSATMPDPGGCYVLVYERPQFLGAHEFLNGPRKYSTLSYLPFGTNFRQRIRSAEIGPQASVTMWADAAFRGASQTFGPGTRHAALSDALSGQVESIDVTCLAPRSTLTP
jgi:hypothetical protein